MNEYRVNLEGYNGPLDLLLYLIRRDEIDIYDIPVAAVTEQYLRYVEMLQQLDPNMAGEFLVLAATLIEIKTRMLLPTPPPEEGSGQGLDIDPRSELVRQLLEYKAFKDAAGDLAEAAAIQALKFPRQPNLFDGDQTDLDLEDVQVWDLLDAFGRLMAAIGQQARPPQVIYDDTPVELHANDILDRLQRDGPLTFRQVFEGRNLRGEIVGLFLALLELVRQKRIFAMQEQAFEEIYITYNPNPPPERPLAADEPVAAASAPAGPGDAQGRQGQAAAEVPAGAGGEPAAQGPAGSQGESEISNEVPDAGWAPPSGGAEGPRQELGQYISDSPCEQEDEDERGTETEGTEA